MKEKQSEASARRRESLGVKCHKHLFLDDAIASCLQLSAAGASRFNEMDQTLHLEVVHGGQVWTCCAHTWKRSHPFKSTHDSSTIQKRAPFTRPFLPREESPLCSLIDVKHAAMHLHVRNKCDTIVTWRSAQSFQILSPALMPKRRLPTPWSGLSQQSRDGALQI